MKTNPHSMRVKRGNNSGQIMVIYGLLCPVLFFFMGLGIDTGLMYVTKSKLSRSVDAVALRLARKYSSVQSERENMAMTIMRANYTGFLTGSSFSSDNQTLDSTNGETLTAVSADGAQKLMINTKSNKATAVVTVKVTAETDHYTFFMPLANVNKAHFIDSATAERFPACNILILDNSGSMASNGGSTNMGPAVKAFLTEFDDARDYLLMVSFNYQPWVLWPIPGEGVDHDRVPPARGFLTKDSNGKSALTVADSMQFTNSTNAASGIRLGGYNVDYWYNTLTPLEKSKIKFNYVFMTDGEFNAVPVYIKGYGFGLSENRYKDKPANATNLVAGTDKGLDFKYDELSEAGKKYHYLKPVYGGDTNEYQVGGANVIFNWYSTTGTVKGTYDLRSKFMSPTNINLGTTNPTPCIQANIQGGPTQKDEIWMSSPIVADAEIPAGSGTSNNTVQKFNNYARGKTFYGGWSGSSAALSYYYPFFSHPKEVGGYKKIGSTQYSESNTYNEGEIFYSASKAPYQYWTTWYSFKEDTWKTNKVTDDTGQNSMPDWIALAQVAYLRKAHNATFYSVGFASADEEIMRNIANQKTDGTAMDNSVNRGKYYKVTSASDLTTTFRDIARQIAVRLSE